MTISITQVAKKKKLITWWRLYIELERARNITWQADFLPLGTREPVNRDEELFSIQIKKCHTRLITFLVFC